MRPYAPGDRLVKGRRGCSSGSPSLVRWRQRSGCHRWRRLDVGRRGCAVVRLMVMVTAAVTVTCSACRRRMEQHRLAPAGDGVVGDDQSDLAVWADVEALEVLDGGGSGRAGGLGVGGVPAPREGVAEQQVPGVGEDRGEGVAGAGAAVLPGTQVAASAVGSVARRRPGGWGRPAAGSHCASNSPGEAGVRPHGLERDRRRHHRADCWSGRWWWASAMTAARRRPSRRSAGCRDGRDEGGWRSGRARQPTGGRGGRSQPEGRRARGGWLRRSGVSPVLAAVLLRSPFVEHGPVAQEGERPGGAAAAVGHVEGLVSRPPMSGAHDSAVTGVAGDPVGERDDAAGRQVAVAGGHEPRFLVEWTDSSATNSSR